MYCILYLIDLMSIKAVFTLMGGRLERRGHLFTDMAQIAKISVSLVAICLLGYFFKEIASSVNKLKDAKVNLIALKD